MRNLVDITKFGVKTRFIMPLYITRKILKYYRLRSPGVVETLKVLIKACEKAATTRVNAHRTCFIFTVKVAGRIDYLIARLDLANQMVIICTEEEL